jgi:predicted amidohydrolase YtcJ
MKRVHYKNYWHITALYLVFGSSCCFAQSAPRWAEYPEFIIHNAKIVTVDDEFTIAEAASIRNGRFEYVGTNAAVLQRAGPRTKKINLNGRTVLPGMADTHNDIAADANDWLIRVDLSEATSIAEIMGLLSDKAKETRTGEWVLGSRGWWEYELEDGRIPTRTDLDDATPNHPTCIPGPHYQICNSLALQIGGVNRDTPDPPSGQISRDESGELTGLLMDAATSMVRKHFPAATRAQKRQGLKDLYARVNSWGITSYREPGGTPEMAKIVHELYEDGELTIRVDWAYTIDANTPEDALDAVFESLGPPGQSFGEGMFRADGIAEVGLDGAELTAFLRTDYPGRPGYRGIQKVPQEQYNKLAAAAARHGWRLGPHAVGDAAIDEVIAAYLYANEITPIADRRWMIDHAFLLLPDHYADIKRLGLIINSQSMHNYQLGKLILEAWKLPLAHMSERYRDWVDNGIIFANGSDGPVAYIENPLVFIYATITRNSAWGGRLGPDQGLSREEAIRSVTSWSALTSFEEHAKGSIEPGKYADFVVLADDILTVHVEQIKDIEVLATVLGGKIVYGSLD